MDDVGDAVCAVDVAGRPAFAAAKKVGAALCIDAGAATEHQHEQ